MRLQLRIIAAAFAAFGVIAWITQAYSPVYLGLIGFGLVGFLLSWFALR